VIRSKRARGLRLEVRGLVKRAANGINPNLHLELTTFSTRYPYTYTGAITAIAPKLAELAHIFAMKMK